MNTYTRILLAVIGLAAAIGVAFNIEWLTDGACAAAEVFDHDLQECVSVDANVAE